jgi:hypothetical protein
MNEYIYLGDRFTDPELKGKECKAVRKDGKCIRKNSKMLVEFDGRQVIVLARRLRKLKINKMEEVKFKVGDTIYINGLKTMALGFVDIAGNKMVITPEGDFHVSLVQIADNQDHE